MHAKRDSKEDSKVKLSPIQASGLQSYKQESRKIVCLTAYDFRTAQILDSEGVIDLILVGDSLANVFAGHQNTFDIGMPEMIYHTKAVARGVQNALLVADMPFLSYQITLAESIKNAGDLIKAGAKAVKVEGACLETLSTIKALTQIGIPVMGHIGYTPQSTPIAGVGKVQGKTAMQASGLMKEAQLLEEAGAFAIVLEMMPVDLAKQITQNLKIPTIGIGAGVDCDGQILVVDDMIGKSEKAFKFSKQYFDFADSLAQASKAFAADIRSRKFLALENSFLSNK
jgi:3-methyl-2-oxobutanoate hydroxymethyltransferase